MLSDCLQLTTLFIFFTHAARSIMNRDLTMHLSQWYPCGFFEAVEALTFITQSSWWAPLTAEVTDPYFHDLWDTTTCVYVRQKVLGVFVSPPSRTYLFAPFNYTPLHKVWCVCVCVCVCGGEGGGGGHVNHVCIYICVSLQPSAQ